MNERNPKRNNTGVDYSGFTVASIVNSHVEKANRLEKEDKSEDLDSGLEFDAETEEQLDLAAEDLFFDKNDKKTSKTSNKEDFLELDDEIINDYKRRKGSNDVNSLEEDEVLLSDDFILSEDDDAAVIKQLEGTVSWYIDGLYNEKGKTHHSLYLKENPPLFIIESSDGSEASFILTKELARTFSKTFGDLNKAYYGSRKERGEKSFDERIKGIPDWARENPIQAIFTFALVFAFFVLLVVTAF